MTIELETKKVPTEGMNEVLLRAKSIRNFETQVHRLGNRFNLSISTSEALLLERLYERLSNKSISQVTTNELSWMITWSEKDIERALYKNTSWYTEHCTNDDVLTDTLPVQDTEGYQEVTPEQLKQIFPDNRSREFVQSVLASGKEETMATFNLTSAQFRSRLNHRIKYCHDHSDLINRVLDTDERKELIKQQRLIEVLLGDIDNSEIDDQGLNVMIATFFDYYPIMHDWLENAKQQLGLKYERNVTNNFTNAGRDSKLFLQYLYKQLDSINNQLEGSNIND